MAEGQRKKEIKEISSFISRSAQKLNRRLIVILRICPADRTLPNVLELTVVSTRLNVGMFRKFDDRALMLKLRPSRSRNVFCIDRFVVTCFGPRSVLRPT